MITLNLKEKCYLVALFGDIPEHRRAKLYAISSLPAQVGPLVIAEGFNFVEQQREKRLRDVMRADSAAQSLHLPRQAKSSAQ